MRHLRFVSMIEQVNPAPANIIAPPSPEKMRVLVAADELWNAYKALGGPHEPATIDLSSSGDSLEWR